MAKPLVQYLRAQNDPNGNPQRLYMVYDAETGAVLRTIDEGYDWIGALRDAGIPRDVVYLPTIDISRADYHQYLRIAKNRLL